MMAAFPTFVYVQHSDIFRIQMYHECHAATGTSLLYTNHVNCLVFMHTKLAVNG